MNDAKGCVVLLIIGLALAVALVVAYTYASDSTTRQTNAQANLEIAQGKARAMVIEAQAESRLHSAQAWAVTAGAIIPFVALGIAGLLGLAIVALSIVLAVRPHQQTQLPPYVVMYLPSPDATRRDLWQAISERRPVLIEAKTGEKNCEKEK